MSRGKLYCFHWKSPASSCEHLAVAPSNEKV